MKRFIAFVISLVCILTTVEASSQKERLMDVYENRGDALYFTLYWHPDSRELFREKIPSSKLWVGFERGFWKKIPEAKKLALLTELAARLDRMEIQKRNSWWKRHNDWHSIYTQLSLIAGSLNPDADEDFIEFAFQDPTLRPGFQWILDSRGPGFNPKHVSTTLATGESVSVFPKLVEHLLDIPEKQRLQCFSRLLDRIAKDRPAKVEPSGADQPTTAPLSKPENNSKSKVELKKHTQ